ncbi:hypothetical protein H6G00_32290 [Leptolyngbya sp. FACHB-541]|uniref:hypothetical protein n=1 Tax=Leptolyngbya sp. FACHB-541 TaxID=2692810 RepID=UPI00168434AB|nr:hypothetical protein [Leptolyngbya sp. FACHB-541]MBD2001221.1 hypothetical protein [Leptolyngbya sp. FACHB-541]
MIDFVGWVKRSVTQHLQRSLVGFRSAPPNLHQLHQSLCPNAKPSERSSRAVHGVESDSARRLAEAIDAQRSS